MGKNMMKRVLSAVLSVVTVCTACLSPLTAVAAGAELEPASSVVKYPDLEDVIDQLAEDEVVTVEDIIVGYGSTFDISVDFIGLEFDEEKVSVKFQEALSEDGTSFSTSHIDTYQAVYYVEPVSGNPVYQVSREITVSEAAAVSAESDEDGGGSSEESPDDDADPDEQAGTSALLMDSPAESTSEITLENGSENTTENTAGDTGTEVFVGTDINIEETGTDVTTADGTEASSEMGSDTESDTVAGSDAEENVDAGTGSEANADGSTDADADGAGTPDGSGEDTTEEAETAGVDEESETGMETELDGTLAGVPALLSLEADEEEEDNKSYVSGLSVSSIVDGTAPFDSDDEAGDDSSDSNRIVRSFDYVSYTLSYTTALSNEKESVDSGVLYVEFVLPCSPDVAIFNMDTMNWMVDPVLTYY
ncbi:MAG: hypothetical protein LUF27_04035, partial [Lachnospiraceae bacterium]|nr:hypothetical protein [Lachnospiraceae bacterium]